MDDHSNIMLVTFAGALVFGVIFVLIAHHIRVSAIVVLLLGGLALGPNGLGIIDPSALGEGLKTIIALAVGLILFEGGLTLDSKGYKQASREIKGVLSYGVLITWLCSAVIIQFLFGFATDFSLLAASLIIVTGPTVIAPMLKRVKVRKKLHSILHWEGVLIDPIGVFIALLCYEWIVAGKEQALVLFAVRCVSGICIGLIAGIITTVVIKRKWIPDESLNIFVVATAIAVFTASDVIAHESGLLSVTIAGFVIGYLAHDEMEKVYRYKAELIDLLIGLLFVLLAANLDVRAFTEYGVPLLIAVLMIMFVVRPLNIFASTFRSELTMQERLFLSWVAPRGIVAASMASLFALKLGSAFGPQAKFLEIFTYSVIAGTVLFQGFTAGWVGKLLGVLEPKSNGWLIIGAHRLGRLVAGFVRDHHQSVVVIDNNMRAVARAKRDGLSAIHGDAVSLDADLHPELYGIGNVLAITGNRDLNTMLCQRWNKELPDATLYRWGTTPDNKQANLGKDLTVGQVVWEALGLERMVDLEVNAEDIGVIHRKGAAESFRHPERVLMCVTGDNVLAPCLPTNATGKCAALTFHPFKARLNVETKPGWIVVSKHDNLDNIFAEMLGCLADDYPEIDTEAIHTRLLKQEDEYPSLVGYGVAIPHAYSTCLNDSIVLLAALENGVTCKHSGEQIKTIFLVLSSDSRPERHLATLSEISTFLMTQEARDELQQANSETAIYNLLFPTTKE